MTERHDQPALAHQAGAEAVAWRRWDGCGTPHPVGAARLIYRDTRNVLRSAKSVDRCFSPCRGREDGMGTHTAEPIATPAAWPVFTAPLRGRHEAAARTVAFCCGGYGRSSRPSTSPMATSARKNSPGTQLQPVAGVGLCPDCRRGDGYARVPEASFLPEQVQARLSASAVLAVDSIRAEVLALRLPDSWRITLAGVNGQHRRSHGAVAPRERAAEGSGPHGATTAPVTWRGRSR